MAATRRVMVKLSNHGKSLNNHYDRVGEITIMAM